MVFKFSGGGPDIFLSHTQMFFMPLSFPIVGADALKLKNIWRNLNSIM